MLAAGPLRTGRGPPSRAFGCYARRWARLGASRGRQAGGRAIQDRPRAALSGVRCIDTRL